MDEAPLRSLIAYVFKYAIRHCKRILENVSRFERDLNLTGGCRSPFPRLANGGRTICTCIYSLQVDSIEIAELQVFFWQRG